MRGVRPGVARVGFRGKHLGVALAMATPGIAHADDDPFQFKLSGYANATIGVADEEAAVLAEAEAEASPQFRLSPKTVFAARIVINASGRGGQGGSTQRLVLPELSAFAIGKFGRIEVGARAGFPQSLIGFTPSEIAFTAGEYGPESGARLDPDGGLPAALLPMALGQRIGRISYLGYAARGYEDRSFKFIYLTPRFRNGLYGAISYTPQTGSGAVIDIAGDRSTPGTRYRDVVQAAIVWNRRSEAVDLSIGGTASRAAPAAGTLPGSVPAAAYSISGGVSLTIRDSWAVGISATYDGLTERRPGGGPAPFGIVSSFNHVNGPWVIGGYYQHAIASSETIGVRRERLDVGQLGVSYLADKNHDLLGSGAYTDVKLFAAVALYALDAQGSTASHQRAVVGLAGVRFSTF